ncbi:MAG: DUF6883 domain-containing protein [Thermosynechococcaceae cyanobacterium]
MTLPHREKAFIQPQKLTGYLLSETHEIGPSKAKLLRAFGFNDNNATLLQQELLKIAYTQDVQEIIPTPHGTKYVLDGTIQAPNGRSLQLRTVWIIDIDQTSPRFVTARPLKPEI